VLLIAQAAILLAFGTTPEPEPTILPQNGIELLGAPVGVDLFILTGLRRAGSRSPAASRCPASPTCSRS
jgi:hypothetical protein